MLANQTQQSPNKFADLLDAYEGRTFRRGEVVTGTIVYIEEDVAYVDVGAKRDAVVPARDLGSLEPDMLDQLKAGNQVQVYITETPGYNGKLIVSIERGLEAIDWQRAVQLKETEETQEYPVIGDNRGGILVEFGRLHGFVPNSQILEIRRAPRSERDNIKRNLLGERLLLKVIEVDQRRRRLVLSEVAARNELRQKRLQELHVGEVLMGQVVSLVPFGAFVDLGGVDGLVHISNLAWENIHHPEEVVQEGEEIEVLVTGVEIERERVSLSRKALLPNPWDEFAREHQVGELLEGVVESSRDFGTFVRLAEGIVGMIHVSEMGDYGTRQPEEVFLPQDKVLVRIIEIDPERERVGLSTRKVTKDEAFDWMTAEDNAG